MNKRDTTHQPKHLSLDEINNTIKFDSNGTSSQNF